MNLKKKKKKKMEKKIINKFMVACGSKLNKENLFGQKRIHGASLVVQWLGIRLPMQGTRVRAPVREDPTCRGAARPMSHSY